MCNVTCSKTGVGDGLYSLIIGIQEQSSVKARILIVTHDANEDLGVFIFALE